MIIKLTNKSILFLLFPVKVKYAGSIKNMYYNDFVHLEIQKSDRIELMILGKKKLVSFENADVVGQNYKLKIAPNYLLVFFLAIFLLILSIGIQIISGDHVSIFVVFLSLLLILFQYRIMDFLLITGESTTKD